MSADGGPQLETLMSVASATPSFLDSYGWILPAVALSLLYLAFLVLIGWLIEDVPFEGFNCFFGIFRWARNGGEKEDPSDV